MLPFNSIIEIVGLLIIYGVLMVAANIFLKKLTGYESPINLATAYRFAGFYGGLGIGLHATLELPGKAKTTFGVVIESAEWGLGILVAMGIALIVNEFLLLPGVNNNRAVCDNNTAVGFVEAGSLVATGFVIAGAMHGTGSVLITILFFALGQIGMVVTARLYERRGIVTQVENGNLAAAIYVTGKIVAISIIMKMAISGDSSALVYDITAAVASFVVGMVLLEIVEWVVDATLIPNARIRDVIEAANCGPLVLVAGANIATALVVAAVAP